MGASYWSYLVPYDDDVERAFRKLQAAVFARREYYSHDPKRRFASIDDLLEAQAEDGTHSILDMTRVVDEVAPPRPSPQEAASRLLAAIAAGAPLPYGTIFRLDDGGARATTPPEPTELGIERGTGRYTVVYEGDRPKSLWFGGISGD